MILETENLIVRKFKADDWEDLSEILTDENVVYYEPYAVFTVAECRDEAIKFARSNNFFAVVLKAENKVIGKIYFNNENNFETYDLGYTFNAKYHGLGYATESISEFIDYSFEHLNVRRITASADVTNEKSWHLLERLGMRREGHHLKTTYKFLDENNEPIWTDSYSYALLREDRKNKVTDSGIIIA
jgi:RimJ/RimL family protein N-acetyltransferase